MIKKLSLPLFRKKTTEQSLSVDNPYLNARRTWNGHVAGLMSALQLWQVLGLISLLISLSAVGGMIYIGSQSKFIPLVFQQDSRGNTISVTRAERIPEAKIDDYRFAVSQFIENIRLVTADADLQRKAVLQTYAYLNAADPATHKANEYLNQSAEVNPFNRAAFESVSIELRSVLQQSKESWQVDWVETVRTREGQKKGLPLLMRAIVTLYQNEPTNQTSNIEALRNPHFLYIRDFNWSKQLHQAG
ncbi:MAG: conjugal transfer protein TrbF [Tatlockia sp.]|nr:conjugal transfer protein TrbF [Tatlockia sp.]